MAFVGIDVGTSGTKALVLSAEGEVLAAAESPHELLSPKPGWSEQDPETWWSATIKAVRKAMAQAGRPQIKGIGLSGQMHGSVFLDRNGKVIRNALLWNDQRTARECEEIETAAGGRGKLIEMVSNPALTGFTAPKILWLRKKERGNFKNTRQVLLPKDFIRYRLTRSYATEVSDASGTLLLNVRERKWHEGLMELLKLDSALFPKVLESQEITGTLASHAASALGLEPNIPVVGGGGDQAAGAVGAGVVTAGLVSASMGTSGVIFAASNSPTTDPKGRVHTMCHAIPDTWCTFGCMLSAGGSLQWLRNTLFAEQMKKTKDAGEIYAAIIDEAKLAPPGSENLFFLPYLTGERCPHADPNAKGGWIGLTRRHNRAHMIRSVIEGITFGMREQIMIFRQMKIPIRQVRAGGGGARSKFWRQMQSDMYNAPVVTINAAEGAALGAAILAAVGTGSFASVAQACSQIIRVKEKCIPLAKTAALYGKQYEKYAALYPALKDFFPAVSR